MTGYAIVPIVGIQAFIFHGIDEHLKVSAPGLKEPARQAIARAIALKLAAKLDVGEPTAITLLKVWLRQADTGLWRDKTGLSLKATPIADDTRAYLPAPPSEDNT
jgi:hypothetical protein